MTCQLRRLVVGSQGILPVLCFQRVNVYGSVGGLGRYVFVQGIPGDALYVVAVLGNLTDEGS